MKYQKRLNLYINNFFYLVLVVLSIIFFNCNNDNGVSQPSDSEKLFLLKGTVLDSIMHQPISSAIVNINNDTTITDSLGEFTFDSLDVGKYQVKIAHEGYDTATFEINLQNDLEIEIKLKLVIEKFFVLEGSVKDSVSYQPIISARVSLNNDSIETDSLGQFKFDSLKAGIYEVNIVHEDYYPETFFIDLQNNLDMDFKLKMIRIDYFPLIQGNLWSYHKEYMDREYILLGTADWLLENTIVSDSVTTYQITETFNGIEIDTWMNDTTYIINQHNHLYIDEYPNNKLHIQRFGNYYPALFDRYYPPSSKDTVEFNYYDFKVRLKKETGIVYLHDHYYNGNNPFKLTYTLLNN